MWGTATTRSRVEESMSDSKISTSQGGLEDWWEYEDGRVPRKHSVNSNYCVEEGKVWNIAATCLAITANMSYFFFLFFFCVATSLSDLGIKKQ